jgi:hypothetical protein
VGTGAGTADGRVEGTTVGTGDGTVDAVDPDPGVAGEPPAEASEKPKGTAAATATTPAKPAADDA